MRTGTARSAIKFVCQQASNNMKPKLTVVNNIQNPFAKPMKYPEYESLEKLAEYIQQQASESILYNSDLHGADDKSFKRRQEAFIAGYAHGTKGDDISNRSHFILDCDGKHKDALTVVQMAEFGYKNNIEAIIYTTASHQDSSPSYRVIFDIGKLLKRKDEHQYQKIYFWLQEKIRSKFGVEATLSFDKHSYLWSQWMFMPNVYFFVKPEVIYISGEALADDEVRWDEISGTPFSNHIKAHKTAKNKTSSIPITNKAAVMHIESTLTQYPKLKYYEKTGNSTQWFRDGVDNYPGVYCLNNMNVINDKGHLSNIRYSPNDFAEAINYTKQCSAKTFSQIMAWERDTSSRCALLAENTGSGKSEHLISLLAKNDGQKRIIALPTRALRAELANRAEPYKDNFHVIYGSKDIILKYVPIDRRDDVKTFFEKEYSGKKVARIGFNKLLQKLEFDDITNNKIIDEYNLNAKLMMGNKSLIMTHAKLHTAVSYAKSDIFENCIVYYDEYPNGCIVKDDPEYKHLDVERIKQLKQMFLSAERMTEIELVANDMEPTIVGGGIKKQLDENLVVLVVDSTTSDKDNNRRMEWHSKVEPIFGDNIIANKTPSPWNLKNCKGSDELKGKLTCTIASFPNMDKELGLLKSRLKIDDADELKRIWATSIIGQAAGRSTGHRTTDGVPHLLIWPKTLPFDLDIVSKYVYREHTWVGNVHVKKSPLYNEINQILGVRDISAEIVQLFDNTSEGYIVVKDAASELGVSSKKITKSIQSLPDFEKKKKKIKVDGKSKTTLVLMRSAA
tara:strand:- start:1664 stop:4033 length:2370 start_codon:yes stop_codon:yes gene_type:complete